MRIIDDAKKNWFSGMLEKVVSLPKVEENMLAEEVEATLSRSFALNKRNEQIANKDYRLQNGSHFKDWK